MGVATTQTMLIMKCYRDRPGDVDATDETVPADDLNAAKEATKKRLLHLFDADRFKTGEQPNTANLVDEHNRIIATFDVYLTRDRKKNEVVERPILPNAGSTPAPLALAS